MNDKISSIYVTRHGLREDWENKTWRSTAKRPTDPPLSKAGFKVAEELGIECELNHRDIKHIIVSPMERCVQTATEIAKRLNLPICLEYGVIEWSGPNPHEFLEPLSVDELATVYNIDKSYKPFTTVIPKGETITELHTRTMECVKHLKQKYQGETIIIVSHAATLIAICRSILGEDENCAYPFRSGVCSLTKINNITNDKWEVEYAGKSTYLANGEQSHWMFGMK